MTDLKQYRENARNNGVCKDYSIRWDECRSAKDVVDMGFGVQALDYLFNSIKEGWGLSVDYISRTYNGFLNGRYVSNQKGYTSSLYCRYKGAISANTDIIGIIESNIDIEIPKNRICEILVVGKAKVRINGKGRCKFIYYGNIDELELSVGGLVDIRKTIKS